MIFSLVAMFLSGIATAQTATLLKLTETGARNERLNIVMLSEGYTAAELTANKFRDDATTIANALLATEPFKSYRPFFNVYGISVASAQSGADQGAAGGNVNTYFNSTFNSFGIDRLLTIDSTGYNRCYSLLNTHVPEYDIVLVIVNDSKYGGSGGAIAVTSTNTYAPEIAIHEIGHSFAGLGDEYDYPGSTPSEDPNTTQETRRAFIKWTHWINAGTPLPTPETSTWDGGIVGLFEGAAYRTTGWYRPTLTSKMKDLGEPFYAVNEEAIILSIYNRVGPITSSSPASAVTVNQPNQTLTFNVGGPATAATAPAIKVEWKLDGSVIAGQTARTLSRLSTAIGSGTHTLVAKVFDPTTKVRSDPSGMLSDTRTWTLNLTNQGPAAPTALTGVANTDGSISLAWTDNATDEAGYAIERATGTAAYVQIGTVGVNVTSYGDTTATAGVSAKYRVKGINSANPAIFGPTSNVVTIVPQIAPAPVSNPAAVTVTRGQPASFTVQASGIPLRYQWKLNGVNIPGATTSIYKLSSALSKHAGSYACYVYNDVGNYTTTPVALTVNGPAEVVQSPVSMTAMFGQTVTLSVVAGGTEPIGYQWRLNNQILGGETNPTLTISGVNTVNSGNYDCVVTNPEGTATSKPAAVTVLGPPIIVAQPTDKDVTRGTNFVLNIAAKGAGPLKYQWRKDGVPINGATKTSFAILLRSDKDKGAYSCVVSNAYGYVTSHAANLSIVTDTVTDHNLVGLRAGTAKWKWVQRVGGTGDDRVSALLAHNGSLFAGGYTASHPALFGTVSVNDSKTEWTGKFQTKDGKPLWIGLDGTDQGARAMSTDSSGDILTRGGAGVSRWQQHAGTLIWSRPMAISNTGGISGENGGSTGYYVSRRNGSDADIVRVDSSGGETWSRTINGSTVQVRDVFRWSTGNVTIVCGTATITGTLELGTATPGSPFVVSGTSGTHGFVAAYSDAGDVVWAGLHGTEMLDLCPGPGPEVYCTGSNASNAATVVILNSSTGALLRTITNPGMIGESVAVTPNGEIAMLMRQRSGGALVSGTLNIINPGYVLSKYTSTNHLLWTLPIVGDSDVSEYAQGRVAMGDDGALYVGLSLGSKLSASFAGSTTFKMSGRGEDGFLAAVSESPIVLTPPQSALVEANAPIDLSVFAAGLSGTTSYQWMKNGVAIKGQTSAAFHKDAAEIKDAGLYTCKITSGGGTVTSAAATINVVDTTTRTLKAPLGKPLELPVTVAGNGLSYIWTKNAVRVFDVGGFTGSATNKLRIASMGPGFVDSYVCQVSDMTGTFDVSFSTDIMLPPVVSPVIVPNAVVSGFFQLKIDASDASAYSITGLPTGLKYDPKTGWISGYPSTAGTKQVTVTASNAAGKTATSTTFDIVTADMAAFARGGFQALVGPQTWNGSLGGILVMNVAINGTVTGSLKLPGFSASLKGRVQADANTLQWQFDQRIARTGKPALFLHMGSPVAQDGLMQGTVYEDAVLPAGVAVEGFQTVWTGGRQATDFGGTFNASLSVPPLFVGDPAVPQAAGSMKTVINPVSGAVSWSGQLGDGVAFSGSGIVWPNGRYPMWVLLYSSRGSLLGAPLLSGATQTGTVDWSRNQVGSGPFWLGVGLIVNGTRAP